MKPKLKTARPPVPMDVPQAAPALGRMRKTVWLATAALAGVVIMTLELAAFRLYAPYFGYSIYVWGSMIGVIMAALAAGYALGGWAADTFGGGGSDRLLYGSILFSAIYQLAMLFAAPSLLPMLASAGDVSGPILATFIIFMPSMVSLATVGPFVIRLLARAGHIGSAAGMIYALSTVGSLVGVFGTSFFLVPTFGTRVTFASACALTGIIAVAGGAGLAARRSVALALAIAPLPFLLAPSASFSKDTIWSDESAYNLVRVVRRRGITMLILNQDLGAHTVRKDGLPWTGLYYDQFALGPLLAARPPRRALVLGMGGGGSITALRAAAPDVQIDAVEIDPKVVDVARRFFGLSPDDARLQVHIADARPWLLKDRGTYEIVQVDLYQGGPYVPFYLATVEFFRLVHAHLSENGVLMMNLLDRAARHELLDTTVATLRQVFSTVAVLPCGNGSYVLCSFLRSQDVDSIRNQLRAAAASPLPEAIAHLAQQAAKDVFTPIPPSDTAPFTDDLSPIEQMTRRMLAESPK